MNSSDITRMLVEITTGKQPAVVDTDEMAAMRLQLKLECDAIVAAGGEVDIPHEVPDL